MSKPPSITESERARWSDFGASFGESRRRYAERQFDDDEYEPWKAFRAAFLSARSALRQNADDVSTDEENCRDAWTLAWHTRRMTAHDC